MGFHVTGGRWCHVYRALLVQTGVLIVAGIAVVRLLG